jgi:hypothetical protein
VRATSLVIDDVLHGFYTSSAPIDDPPLDAFVRKHLPYYSVPERWIRVGEIPLNPNGKVDKVQLKILAAEHSTLTADVKPMVPIHNRHDSAFGNLVSEKVVAVPQPVVIAGDGSRTTLQDMDLEKGYQVRTSDAVSPSESADKPASLPSPQGSSFLAWVRHRLLIAYRWLLLPIVFTNIGVACWILNRGIKHDEYPLSPVTTATAANLCAAILVRSEPVINLLFTIFSSVPTWLPLSIRRICANVYHIGGIHVGCAMAAVIWFIIFTVGASLELSKDASTRSISLASTILCYIITVLLVVVSSLSHPTFRNKYHDLWESCHRFGGWTILILYWVLLGLSTKDLSRRSSLSTPTAYLQNPSVWLITAATLSIIFPWLFLRRIHVRPEILSSHAIRLHFSNTNVAPGKGVRIAFRPLGDWHAFASITNSDMGGTHVTTTTPSKKGYSVIVSRAGDFTSHIIDTPPSTLYTRGIPTSGVLRIATLFTRVVLVATGSGIGPCLSIFPYANISMRILWSCANPTLAFGHSIVDDVYNRDPRALVWDTRSRGKPDLIALAERFYNEGAEAVLVISNKGLTRRVIGGLRRRGVCAHGAIFDS